MLAKRIIPCLDIKNAKVVKGVEFDNHQVVGDIIELAKKYSDMGADELVFYDITASSKQRLLDKSWVRNIAKLINIPFCVAGGIRSIEQARTILNNGADKISINSPALENPAIIDAMAREFGSQCIVLGLDSKLESKNYYVYQYAGSRQHIRSSKRLSLEWAYEAQERGVGELVLNCMNEDGRQKGYDIEQLCLMRQKLSIPIIASGGAGSKDDFYKVFKQGQVDGSLAATVFHKNIITIPDLKKYLSSKNVEIRL